MCDWQWRCVGTQAQPREPIQQPKVQSRGGDYIPPPPGTKAYPESHAGEAAEAIRGIIQGIRARLQASQRQRIIDTENSFYQRYPEFLKKKMLITAIVFWVNGSMTEIATFERAKEIAESLQQGPRLTGRWFGIVTFEPDQSKNLVFFDLVQEGKEVTGLGQLRTGQELMVTARTHDDELSGVVVNTTEALESEISGMVGDTYMRLSFSTRGAGVSSRGSVVLLR